MARGAPDFIGIIRDIGVETLRYHWQGNLADGGDKTVVDIVGQDIIITYMEFAMNTNVGELHVQPYKKDGTLDTEMQIMESDGSKWNDISPQELQDENSIVWLQLKHAAGTSEFKYGTGFPLRFSNGVKIWFENPSGATKTFAFEAMVEFKGG